MPAQLVPAASRPRAIAAIAAGVLVTGVLAGLVFRRHSTGFDSWAFRELIGHVGADTASALLGISTPAVPITLMVFVVLGAMSVRRRDLALLAVVGPLAAVLITEVVLKPLVGRVLGPAVYLGFPVGPLTGSYPSGHETGVVSAAVVLVLVCRQLPLRRRGRVVAGTLLALWSLAAAVGLVRNYWHYATDTVGGAGVALAAVLGAALLIDRYLPARWRSGPESARSAAGSSRAGGS